MSQDIDKLSKDWSLTPIVHSLSYKMCLKSAKVSSRLAEALPRKAALLYNFLHFPLVSLGGCH